MAAWLISHHVCQPERLRSHSHGGIPERNISAQLRSSRPSHVKSDHPGVSRTPSPELRGCPVPGRGGWTGGYRLRSSGHVHLGLAFQDFYASWLPPTGRAGKWRWDRCWVRADPREGAGEGVGGRPEGRRGRELGRLDGPREGSGGRKGWGPERGKVGRTGWASEGKRSASPWSEGTVGGGAGRWARVGGRGPAGLSRLGGRGSGRGSWTRVL